MSFLYWSVTGCSVTFDHQTLTVNFYGGIFLPSPHLSDTCNYVELSDLYTVLSDLSVDLPDHYVDLSLIHVQENKSLKSVLALLMP